MHHSVHSETIESDIPLADAFSAFQDARVFFPRAARPSGLNRPHCAALNVCVSPLSDYQITSHRPHGRSRRGAPPRRGPTLKDRTLSKAVSNRSHALAPTLDGVLTRAVNMHKMHSHKDKCAGSFNGFTRLKHDQASNCNMQCPQLIFERLHYQKKSLCCV